jgi:hypothetical protein
MTKKATSLEDHLSRARQDAYAGEAEMGRLVARIVEDLRQTADQIQEQWDRGCPASTMINDPTADFGLIEFAGRVSDMLMQMSGNFPLGGLVRWASVATQNKLRIEAVEIPDEHIALFPAAS